MTYIAWDSYANPYHKERVQAFTSKVKKKSIRWWNCFLIYRLFAGIPRTARLSIYVYASSRLRSCRISVWSTMPARHSAGLNTTNGSKFSLFLCPFRSLYRVLSLQAFVTVKGFGMKWPWNDNLTNFERKLNSQWCKTVWKAAWIFYWHKKWSMNFQVDFFTYSASI